MEELLLDIIKESSGSKGSHLREACQHAYDLLCSQQGTTRDPSYELRRICFIPLQIALETKRPKLVSLALNGFHRILRDDRFHKGNEPEDDSLWLPSQLLCATSSMASQSQETQINILRVLLALGIHNGGTLNGRLVLWVAGRCAEAAAAPPVAAAARAAAAMTIRAFCLSLDEECQEILSENSYMNSKISAAACFSEIIPIMQYLCSRLCETQLSTKANITALFFLECLLTLVTSLPEIVNSNSHFTNFLWQKFCPALISFLGTPRVDKNLKFREEGHGVDDSGRGSGSLASAPSFNSQQAKCVYSIAAQLIRLVGCVGSLRPVLEALYHRMLLYPPISHRAEALSSTKDLLKDPKKLCSLLILKQSNIIDQYSDEMALIRLIMDAIEECAVNSNPNILLVSLECVIGLLEALEELCEGKYVPGNASDINDKWPNLEDADYRGPLTYQSLARLPSPYRDLVAEMQNKMDDASDSSNTSGPEDNSAGSDGELDSDADSVFLPSRPHHIYDKSQEDYMESREDNDIPYSKPVPRTLNLGRCNITDYNVDIERQNAKQFVKTLQNVMVPKLLSFRTCIEVDESMQDFASKCCQYNASRSPGNTTIMNADGIYLATYSALLLNLKLIISGYYKGESTTIPLSEEDFVEEVQGSGVLVYLSAMWLSELYQQIITTSILEVGGFQPSAQEHNALVNLLMDFGGIGPHHVMCDWQRLKEVSMPNACLNKNESKTATLKLARRLLTCMWDSMVTLLSASLVGKYCNNGANIHSHVNLQKLLTRKSRFSSKKDKVLDTCVTLSLEGLHKAARISNILRLQNRCSSLLELLSKSACSEPPSTKILSAHAQSLDVLITGGLELGSHSVDCWKHIFSACQYVYHLEHTLFGQQCNTTTPLITLQTSRNKTVSFTQNSSGMFFNDKIHPSFNIKQNHMDDETCVDVYDFLQSNVDNSSSNNKMSVASIIQKCNKETNRSNPYGYISGTDAAKVCCALSQHVDILFNDAASKLNLPALCSFLEELCVASEKQLYTEGLQSEQHTGRWWKGVNHIRTANMASGGLLNRVGEVTLQCLKAPRPLAHHMSVWTIVGPHFMKAACNKDRRISKKAIQCIHDAVTMLLNEQIELPHFHFNEALLKPFENLLCLELCDSDVQEQIISCICEFVEANQTEIKSGWRPLFGTLRAAHNSNQYSAVLEIFRVFLNTDNTLVFANAAVDCILCLLSYLRGSNFDFIPSTDNELSNENISPNSTGKTVFNLSQIFVNKNFKTDTNGLNEVEPQITYEICKESLRYIESCAEILGMMYSMPKCPTFNTAHRMNTDMPLQVVDALFPKSAIHIKHFTDATDTPENNVISYRILSTTLPNSQTIHSTLSKIDRPSGVLKVWHLLLDGLISASLTCPQQFQGAALETLFKILQDIMVIPGPIFGLHIINHLLLPSMQNWLRQFNGNESSWGNFTLNFKQCCGMTTDLIVRYLHHLQEDTSEYENKNTSDTSYEESMNQQDSNEIKALTFALKQLLLILVECISQPQEIIARLGASCIRHIILTSGNLLSPQQWEITCTSLHRACNASLTPLQQLTLAFEKNSDSFYGDLAIVKVAARCDSSINDNVRLHSMSQQVFYYDYSREHSINANSLQSHNRSSHNITTHSLKNYVLTDDRSYIFLLYPHDAIASPNPDLHLIRISLKSLVMGLLAHQILVQIIATILLQQSSNIMPLNHILFDTFKSTGLALNKKYNLTHHNLEILLKCLDMSYKRTISFDLRPGLKFLVQKVSNLDNAANLYKHTTASWIVKVMAATELFCLIKISNTIHNKQNLSSTKNELRHTWDTLCDLYIDAIEVDCVAAELAISEKSLSINEAMLNSIEEHSSNSDMVIENKNEDGNANNVTQDESNCHSTEAPKPFTFSDFRKVSSNSINENNTDNNAEMEDRDDSIYNSKDEQCEKRLKNIASQLNGAIKFNNNENNTQKPLNNNQPIKTSQSRNNSSVDPLLPAQPIPPEIEQERIHSITKDAEAKRIAFANTLAAYIELVLTFPDEEFEALAEILNCGLLRLSEYATDSLLLQRIDAFLNRKDSV